VAVNPRLRSRDQWDWQKSLITLSFTVYDDTEQEINKECLSMQFVLHTNTKWSVGEPELNCLWPVQVDQYTLDGNSSESLKHRQKMRSASITFMS